jgi:CheY-like chemotaxis protein
MDKKTIQFYVKDTGIGIDEKHQKDIFKSFRQIDGSDTRKFGGTGLGLTITHRLVELFGGDIWVDSEINKGSCFHFTLPYGTAKKSTPIIPLEAIESESYNWGNKTILIVDDEKNNYTYFKAALNNTKARLLWAKDGEEAVQICQNETIDIILMDIQMPRMNGYEATREIKQMDNTIPIIGQTAYAQKEHKEKVLAAGCDDYLAKPIRSSVLLESISKHMVMN